MNLTQIIIVSIFVLVLTYTAFAQKVFDSPTVSKTLRDWAWKYNSIGWLAGFLIGHWFFPRQEVKATAWGGFGIPLAITLAAWDLYWNLGGHPRTWYRWPGWYVLIGISTGVVLWSQGSKHAPL